MTRIRVLVVDDSAVVRKLVTQVLAADPEIEVAGTAANGRIALAKVAELGPDLVTMDIEMPELDGIAAVRALRRSGHRMPIIMFSTLSERGATATLEALAAGATDYVTKPTNAPSLAASMTEVGAQLIPRVKALVARSRPAVVVPSPDQPPTRVRPTVAPHPTARIVPDQPVHPAGRTAARPSRPSSSARPVVLAPEPPARGTRAVVIGSSTGGPEALSKFFAGLTAPLPVPMLLVQHMPPLFTRQLALRLDRLGPTTVLESAGGEPLEPGHAYLAPGDRHLVVRKAPGGGFATELSSDPPVNYCRPSVDVLFRSAVQVIGGQLLAVVLTGMGADGRTGCDDVMSAGGTVYVQDEASSVVWGMPGAVATAGLAHRVLPVTEVAAAVQRRLAPAVPTAPMPARTTIGSVQ